MSETVLWTNPSPGSSFSVQNVALSQSFRDFKYVKIYSKNSVTSSTSAGIAVEPTDIVNSTVAAYNRLVMLIGAVDSNGSAIYCRRLVYVNDTTLNIGDAGALNRSAVNNNYSIPIKIVGLK
jgi:hypothetical protein